MPVRNTHIPFGQRLRNRRRTIRPKLSQEELAERVGLTHGTISRLERGLIKRVSMDTLARLAQALNCSPGDLMDASEDQPDLRDARVLLGRIAPEDLASAVKALRGFVREVDTEPTTRAKRRRRNGA